MASSDFKALAPIGFQTVLQMRTAFTDVEGSFSYLMNSRLIALANNDRSAANQTITPLYGELSQAMEQFHSMSTLPIGPFRDVLTYCDLFGIVVPESAKLDSSSIGEALRTIVMSWQITDNKLYNDYNLGARQQLTAVGSALAPVHTAFLSLTKFMEAELSDDQTTADPKFQLQSIFKLLRAGLQPLVTISNDHDGQLRLNNTLGLALDAKQFQLTFAQLVKLNKSQASEVLAVVSAFDATIKVHIARLASIQAQLSSLVSTYSGFLLAMSQVSTGINSFAPSTQGSVWSSSDKPDHTRSDVVKSWSIVGANANLYIQDIGNPSTTPEPEVTPGSLATFRVSPNSPLKVAGVRSSKKPAAVSKTISRVSQSTVKTPGEVRKAFGAPEEAATSLSELASQTVTIGQAFDALLTVPYADILKVTLDNGSEVSIRDMVTGMQTSYLALQVKTLPVAQNLNTDAGFQLQILPTINQPGGTPLNVFLPASLQLVLSYAKSAASIVRETTGLRDEFQGYLNILNQNLTAMETQISSLEDQIKDAEAEYVADIVTACVQGVLFLAFTIGTLATLASGVGAATGLAAALGLAAIGPLASCIASAVAAGKLASVISGLKGILKTCQDTRNNLQDAIPKLSTVVDLMSNISDVWSSIVNDLQDIEKHETLWTDPLYFTKDMLTDTIQSWTDLQTACNSYGMIVGGLNPPTSASFEANSPFVRKEFENMVIDPQLVKDEPPPVYSAYAEKPFVARISLERNGQDDILNFLSAPDVAAGGLRKSELMLCASTWMDIGQSLKSIGQEALSSDCQTLGSMLRESTSSQMTAAVKSLLDFARLQPSLPSLPVDAEAWQLFCDAKLTSLGPGNKEAVICNTLLRNLQNQAGLVYDTCIARRRELQYQADQKQKELSEATSSYDSYRWLIYIPSPIAIIMEQLIENIRRDKDDMDNIRGQLEQIDNALNNLQGAMNIIQRLFKYTATIATFWASLTTKIHTSASLWVLLEQFPSKEVEMAQSTWRLLEGAFGDWE